MINSKKTLNYLLIALLGFICMPVLAQAKPDSNKADTIPLQIIQDLSTPIPLDTSLNDKSGFPNTHNGVWWVSDKKIDPIQISAEYLTSNQKSEKSKDGWHQVTVPDNIYKHKPFKSDRKKEYWYKKSFYIKKASSKKPLSLQLGKISDRDEVYLNGIKIGSTGDWDNEQAQAYDKMRLYDIPEDVIRYDSNNILLVHVKGYFPVEMGILSDAVLLGYSANIWQHYYNTSYIEVLFLVLYFSVASYFLFLFIRQKKSRENLLFAIFTYTLILYQFNRTQIRFETGFDFFAMKRSEFLALAWVAPFFYYFLRSFLSLPKNKFTKIFDWLVIILMLSPISFSIGVIASDDIIFWDDLNKLYHLNLALLFMLFSLSVAVYSGLGIRKSRFHIPYIYLKPNIDARLMLFGLSLFLCAVGFDAVVYKLGIYFPRVVGYAFIVFVLTIALILANRFVRLHNEVEDLNKNLEAKVEKRTEELNNTLSEVRTLKEKQDGDYFLTSLLINPLGGNYSTNELVDVQMITHQKKKFRFREKESEIGGDINVSHDIVLRDRAYTIILNADAMGKSIQGAGGALVLGTVFKSIVNRTKHSSLLQNNFPEQWLKMSFSELQDVFVSFDGSMLISLVMGLIDQENGMFYYINAEHPYVALYRDGKASFMEKEHVLRKVGVDVMNEGLTIQVLELKEGDIIYMGSDGRDDILIGDDESGNRIINEDEQKFLRHIENGQGELARVERSILDSGDLTDDFTLIRIAYREHAPFPDHFQNADALELANEINRIFKHGNKDSAIQLASDGIKKYPDNPVIVRQMIRMLILEKKFVEMIPYIEKYSKTGAEDLEFLYFASYAYKQVRKYELAADYGERCRMRNPQHLNNLANLIDVYRINNNLKRAKKLLIKGLEIDPDHDLLKLVTEKIKI